MNFDIPLAARIAFHEASPLHLQVRGWWPGLAGRKRRRPNDQDITKMDQARIPHEILQELWLCHPVWHQDKGNGM